MRCSFVSPVPAPTPCALSKYRIPNRSLLYPRLILKQRGYTVALAADGSEGLIYLQTHAHPDLIILDMLMNGMDGWQFIKYRDTHWPTISILIATALPSATDEWAASLGACAWLQKPIDEDVLADKVVKCLEFRNGRSGECASKSPA